MNRFNLFKFNFAWIYTNVHTFYKYYFCFTGKQNRIPVRVSPYGLEYTNEKNITLKELMRIKEVCQNHLSDHYMLTPGTIKQLGININGSTIEAYTQACPQEIRSFIKCVLPRHHKDKASIIKNWIIEKRKHNVAVKYDEIIYYLRVVFNITEWNEPKFPEIECYLRLCL